jgi:hypothetical protein
VTEMRGGVLRVWAETHREIWAQLADHDDAPADLYVELYRELVPRLVTKPEMLELAAATSDPVYAAEAFQAVSSSDFISESQLVAFLEAASGVLDDFACEGLTDLYFELLESFVEKFSLRYDLRRPCLLVPTLAGIFSSLMSYVAAVACEDTHLGALFEEFESSLSDLHSDRSEVRIKTVIQKQFNLLEGMGARHPNATKHTLGAIADELETWPHAELRNALKGVYKFGCDYPGIRHGGRQGNALGKVATRDLVGVGILLIGFIPYLSDGLDCEAIFRGEV